VNYLDVKLVHESAVALSLTGFFVRGAASLAGAQWLRTRLAKTLPHVVDSVLLLSALALAWTVGLTPMNSPWLLAKICGLVVYVGLGIVALSPRASKAFRAVAWAAALATAGWIVCVAITKNPLGYFASVASLLS
jgi:uncharacterized membrane protein SirB2